MHKGINKACLQFLFQATEKLVVFMFGIVSHQIADILWHSLGIDQGFLATMGNVSIYVRYCVKEKIADIVLHRYSWHLWEM